LNGTTRIYDTTVDVGAYEFNPSLGIDDVEEKNRINVYPNPTNGIVNFVGITGDFGYEIYSITGALVKKGIVTTTSTLNISDLNAGVYIVKTSTYEVIRLVKK